MIWPTRAIAEFCKTGTGTTPLRAEGSRFYGGSIPWVKSGELSQGVVRSTEETLTAEALEAVNIKMVEPGALLVALYGATVGQIAELGIRATTNQAVCHVIPDPKIADKRYLYYALRRQGPIWIGQRVGGAQPNISQGIVKDTMIPLPPLPEQRRIAAILDKADAIRRKREEGIRLTEELLRSTFLEMFGDPATNPNGLEVVPLGAITELVTSGLTPTGGSTVYVDQGPIFIRSQNVLMNRLDLSDVACLPEAIHESMSRTKVHVGDVLLNITGASIGRVAWVAALPKEANVNQHVCLIRLVRCKATPEFMSVFLSLPFGQQQIDSMQSGASRQGLNHQQVRSLKIPLPPMPLQKRYSQAVNKLRTISDQREQGRLASEELFNSLVQRAFRGEL